jgi:hypothetical protein
MLVHVLLVLVLVKTFWNFDADWVDVWACAELIVVLGRFVSRLNVACDRSHVISLWVL